MKYKRWTMFLLCTLLSFIPLVDITNAITVKEYIVSSDEPLASQFSITVRSEEGDIITTGLAKIFDANYNSIKNINVSPQGKLFINGLKDGNYIILVWVYRDDYAGSEYEHFTISGGQLTHFKGQECKEDSIVIIVKSVQFQLSILTPDGNLFNNRNTETVYPGLNGAKRASYSFEDGIYKLSYIEDGENKIYAVGGSQFSMSDPVTLFVENGKVITVDGKPYTGEVIRLTLKKPEESTPKAEDIQNILDDIIGHLEGTTRELVGENDEITRCNILSAVPSIQNAIISAINTQFKENADSLKTALSNAMSRISDAMKTITNDDDLHEISIALIKAILNVVELTPPEINSPNGKTVAEMVKCIIESVGEAINQVGDINKADDIARTVVHSMDLIHKMDTRTVEKKISDRLTTIMESVIEKASKQSIEIEKTGDAAVVSFSNTQLEETIKKMNRISEIKENLQKSLHLVDIRDILISKIIIDVPVDTVFDSIMVELPEKLLKAAVSKGIERIDIAAGDIKISIPWDFTENAVSQPCILNIGIDKIISEILSGMTDKQKQVLEDNTSIFSFSIVAGDNKVTEFQKPFKININYELKEKENPDHITVLALADDGSIRNMTGKYNEADCEVIFNTTYSGKYIVKNLVRSFSDVPVYFRGAQYINSMASKGIIDGYGDGKFHPDDSISRAEFVKMLTVASGLFDTAAAIPFTDVPENKWYHKYVSIAYKVGLTDGINNREFEPQKKITRMETASMIAKAMPTYFVTAYETEKIMDKFKDNGSLSGLARKEMALAVKAEIISGDTEMKLYPDGLITRAEAATMIYKYFNYYKPLW